MTPDEIIEMAEEAGVAFASDDYPEIWATYMHVGKKELVAFANFVAAKALAEHAMRETQRLGQEIEQEPVGMVKDLFTYTAWEKLDVRGSTKVYLDIPPQPEQKPVIDKSAAKRIATALGWTPPRTWVGLTDEEIDALHMAVKVRLMGTFDTKDIYRVVEQALKGKNT